MAVPGLEPGSTLSPRLWIMVTVHLVICVDYQVCQFNECTSVVFKHVLLPLLGYPLKANDGENLDTAMLLVLDRGWCVV
jgi:hypothetical protein